MEVAYYICPICLTVSHCFDNKNPLMHLSCRCPLAFVSQKEQLKSCQRHYLPCRFVLLLSILADVFVHLHFCTIAYFVQKGFWGNACMLCQGNQGQIGQNETSFILQGMWQLQQRKEPPLTEQYDIKPQTSPFGDCIYTLHWECTDDALCHLIAVP